MSDTKSSHLKIRDDVALQYYPLWIGYVPPIGYLQQ